MPPPHALPSPRVRSHAHPRATMRTAATCSIFDCLAPVFLTSPRVPPGPMLAARARRGEAQSSFDLCRCADVYCRVAVGRRQVLVCSARLETQRQHAEGSGFPTARPMPLNPSFNARADVGCSAHLWAR